MGLGPKPSAWIQRRRGGLLTHQKTAV